MVAESRPLQLIAPTSTSQDTSTAIATQPCLSILSQRIIRRLYMCAKRKLHSSKLFDRSGPSYTPYGGGESTNTAHSSWFASEVTSSATATVPRHPGHTTHVKRRLYMYAIRIMRHVRRIGVITMAFRMLHILSFTLSYVLILVHILHTLSTCEYLFYSTYACFNQVNWRQRAKQPATAVCCL